ncbi:4-oxalocrotonate decarboxylase [Streptomyces sp. SID10853]|uniref:2-keto-4-pentenoate hydratase n=1 Tax=Streptomyces sp. SID10853 TaxID=2706028 RepID=UPI0013BF8545|nr:fumarylacetoacetate hydrolase family protein [Streptomyces sp. SID10853]NDZ78620.1 4-oxalocrotonate decarboxylase [Streptomyces sp. SID10853]
MTQWTTEKVARELLGAEHERRDRDPFTDAWPDFSLADAYAAQDRLLDLKREQGERVIGVKLGLTSRAKQQRMGISSPLTAWLTDAMVLPQGEPVPLGELIHPRIEPEIVFVMGERLEGPGVTGATALAAVRSVHAGFEIIDSRYRDFRFRLPDVVADNASSSRLVVNPTGYPVADLDLALEGCVFRVDGEVVDTATGAAVQGHPAEALALAANSLAARGQAIEAGALVLTGGLTDAVTVTEGTHAVADFTRLGSVSVAGR